MAYNTAKMITDASGKLIPQLYDPVSDTYKPLTPDAYNNINVNSGTLSVDNFPATQQVEGNVQLTGSTTPLDINPNLQIRKTPTGFRWQNHPLKDRIYFDPLSKKFTTDFDVSELDPHKDNENALVLYVDPVNGDNNNDGLTEATALASANRAFNDGADIIMLMDGLYDFVSNGFSTSGMTLDRDLSIKAVEGHEPILIPGAFYTWTKTTNQTNVYQIDRSIVEDIRDATNVDENGDMIALEELTSIADVDAQPNSWYTDGTTVYIHLHDSREPATNDQSIRVYLSIKVFEMVNENYTLYMEGVSVESRGFDLRDTVGNGVFLFKGCRAKYGTLAGCFRVLGSNYAIMQNCEGAKGASDGFNYHVYSGIIPKAIEIDCVGRDNGTSSTDNGSTMHDGGVIIRLSGSYFRNAGPNMVDVNDKTHSWNINCTGYGSKATNIAQNADFMITDGTAEMWLDHCVAYGSEEGLNVGTDSKAYVRESKISIENIAGKKYAY